MLGHTESSDEEAVVAQHKSAKKQRRSNAVTPETSPSAEDHPVDETCSSGAAQASSSGDGNDEIAHEPTAVKDEAAMPHAKEEAADTSQSAEEHPVEPGKATASNEELPAEDHGGPSFN